MISTAELKKGATIELDGKLMSVMDYAHIKTGRGSAQVKVKFRDVRSGEDFVKIYGKCLTRNAELKITDIRPAEGLAVTVKTDATAVSALTMPSMP